MTALERILLGAFLVTIAVLLTLTVTLRQVYSNEAEGQGGTNYVPRPPAEDTYTDVNGDYVHVDEIVEGAR
jgi:hypothetical protein